MNYSPHIITFPDPRAVSLAIRASAVVFADPKSLQLLSLIDRVAPSNANILIIGETGTGKELVARQVHLSSLRASKPFLAINCGAFSETLFESELFGFEKGAFTGATIRSAKGNTAIEIKSLCIDSRQAWAGSCFIALRGTKADGQAYIDSALEKGAVAVICEALPEKIKEAVTYIQVENAAEAAGYMSHNFYGGPSLKLKLVGVTGTNGKTTIATLLWKLFTVLGYKCGLISTVQNQIGDKVIEATHTTPDAVNINSLLKQMADEVCDYVFMECSSHAIHQHRIAGLQFAGALLTNITHDHLDYHKTFDEYIRVKKSWFDKLLASAFAISNADDKRGTVMLQNTRAKKYFYSLKAIKRQPWTHGAHRQFTAD